MPSGPKKRKAARRRKQQKEEEHRHGNNGNGSDGETGSDSIVDDDDLSSSAATTPTPRSQHHLPNEPPNLDLDLGHHQHHHKHHQEEQRKEKQSDVEDWVRQSEFDVGTPPPQTPSLAREEADEEHNHFGDNQKHQSPPVETIEELEPSAPAAAAAPPTADPVDTAPAPAPAPAARIDDQKPAAAVDDHPAAAGPKSVTETTSTDGKSSAATADEHQKVPERASGCCGVLDWLLGRTG